MCVGRIFVSSAAGQYWLMGYSMGFLVYGIALVKEVVNARLPYMSKGQAGAVVFFGHDPKAAMLGPGRDANDLAGMPEFALGAFSFLFLLIILISAFTKPKSLPLPHIGVLAGEWPIYVFGVLAFLLVLVLGLAEATVRAFYLARQNLLRGAAKSTYLVNPVSVRVPAILAGLTYTTLACAGLFTWAATGASAVFTLCLFAPPIALLAGQAKAVWMRNDCNLVRWPPHEAVSVAEPEPSDAEVAYGMFQDLLGPGDGAGGGAGAADGLAANLDHSATGAREGAHGPGTMANFQLPALETTHAEDIGDIKMPMLPPKSTLRKKRAAARAKGDGGELDPLAEGDMFDQLPDEDDADGDTAVDWEHGDAGLDAGGEATVAQFVVAKVVRKRRYDIGLRALRERKRDPETGELPPIKTRHYIVAFIKNRWAAFKSLARRIARATCVRAWRWLKATYASCRGKKYAPVGDAGGDPDEGAALVADDGEGGEEDGEATGPAQEDWAEVPYLEAIVCGCLLPDEYAALGAWFGSLGLLVLMGVVIAASTRPSYLGHLLWSMGLSLALAAAPVVKYFNVYQVTRDMKLCGYAAMSVFYCALISVFLSVQDAGPDELGPLHLAGQGDAQNAAAQTGSLWILDAAIFVPLLLWSGTQFLRWADNGWRVASLDRDGDGEIEWHERLLDARLRPWLLTCSVLFNFQVYIWGKDSPLAGVGVTLFLVTALLLLLALRDWAANNFSLSPFYVKCGDCLVTGGMIAAAVSFVLVDVPGFSVSLFFLLFMFRTGMQVVGRVMALEPESQLYFSPYVFPVYSYSAKHNDVFDETPHALRLFLVLFTGVLWGVSTATLMQPVSTGVVITCVFLLMTTCSAMMALEYVPLQLGRAAKFVSDIILLEAADAAKDRARERAKPFTVHNAEWDEVDEAEAEEEDEPLAAAAGVGGDGTMGESAAEIATKIDDELDALRFVTAPDGTKLRRADALWTFPDAWAEALIVGKGPLGAFGLKGLIYKVMKKGCQKAAEKASEAGGSAGRGLLDKTDLDDKILSYLTAFDEHGRRTKVTRPPMQDARAKLLGVCELDDKLRAKFAEESRCFVHFQLLVAMAADARLQHEKVLFQKFLRENRFKLLSNGIAPPKDVFSGQSFASIDIQLVAVWLSTLQDDERERFHLLKTNFSEEQAIREREVDRSDEAEDAGAFELAMERAERESAMCQKRFDEYATRREVRETKWARTLPSEERERFGQLKKTWNANPSCTKHEADIPLWEKYASDVLLADDETTGNTREQLTELESGDRNCRVGATRYRPIQFEDPEFPHGNAAFNEAACLRHCGGWQCSLQINPEVKMFGDGTDPDDVFKGRIETGWLLSALSMLAAAGGVGDGGVDPQIKRLFVSYVGRDGSETYDTSVGAYAVNIHRNGQWESVIVDDFFPVGHEPGSQQSDNDDDKAKQKAERLRTRGAICAHADGFAELWVPLLEKAVAKYYGGYGEIERGFCHHALEFLTGNEAECMYLAKASRGAGKGALWGRMLQYKSNEYIMGAGTVEADQADHWIQDMGLVFGQTYTIYDVRAIDGHKLIKLRNPPGDHDEWHGDWGDASPLWTSRLKRKLGMTEEDDNTFWMAFDDFCTVFRCLYVCHYYHERSTRWKRSKLHGMWSSGDDPEGDGGLDAFDTAAGLPSKHNRSCDVGKNPQYGLKILFKTTVRLIMHQIDARGLAPPEIHPVAMYLCKDEEDDGIITPVSKLTRHNVVAHTGTPERHRTCSIYTELQPGNYSVLLGTYMPGMEGPFTLEVITNQSIGEIEQIVPPAYETRAPTAFDKLMDKAGAMALDKIEAAEDKVAEMQEQAKGKEKPTMYTRDQGEKKGDDEDDLL